MNVHQELEFMAFHKRTRALVIFVAQLVLCVAVAAAGVWLS